MNDVTFQRGAMRAQQALSLVSGAGYAGAYTARILLGIIDDPAEQWLVAQIMTGALEGDGLTLDQQCWLVVALAGLAGKDAGDILIKTFNFAPDEPVRHAAWWSLRNRDNPELMMAAFQSGPSWTGVPESFTITTGQDLFGGKRN